VPLRSRPLWLLDDPRSLVRVPVRLLASVTAAAAALWLVGALEPALGHPVFFPSFVVIVLVSAELAGTRYGILAVVVFGAGYAFLYQEPRGVLALEDPRAVAVLAAYAIAGLVVAGIGGALRKAYERVRDEHRAVITIHQQREDLLKALAHDVRSPLGVISTQAALMARDAGDPAAVLRRARAIEKSAESIEGMLGDLIDAARLESGHLPLEREPVDVARFVPELASRLEGTLPLDRVQLAIPEGLPAVYVDPRRLERILLNLLSNALKYAPPPAPVTVSAALQERSVVVSVSDRGPGIAP
jgi:K+-sensing histidine kinase KdpD